MELFNYFQIFLTILLMIFLYYIFDGEARRRKMNAPNVSGGVPFFGQVFKMLHGSPWLVFKEWSRTYGQIATFHLFGSNALLVSDPELLRVILQTKVHIFQKDLDWVYKPFLVILGNGLVTAHGENWRRQRTLLSSALRIDILQYIPQMAISAVKRFSKKLNDSCQTGEPLEMAEEFRTLTLQVIAEAILSLEPSESDSTFAKMYLPIVEEGNLRTWHPERMYLTFLPAYQTHLQNVKRLNEYVVSVINKRWELKLKEKKTTPTLSDDGAAAAGAGAGARPYDILDKVLDAIPVSDWNEMTRNQVRDEVKTFILAGHETSASMLAWSLYELTLNEKYLERARQQAADVFGIYHGDDRDSDYIHNLPSTSTSHIEISRQLSFLDCCLRESLRKYSVVPTVVRVPSQDVEYNGHVIPKGTSVMINIMGVHHDEKYWPNSDEYLPDRFANGETSGGIAPYTFLPFVDGPRNCLGQFLSLLETKIVLALLVHFYDFELVNKEDAGLSHPYMVPIIPRTGHFMKISKRRAAGAGGEAGGGNK
jgi:cytochrome P450